ncbi:MAG: class I SAM-dependent methyltransferase, partial [Gammaproteobacteria bacterium]|nr:class I SAM-dependent methyltransferase [Gammaproteobacteria bacterium]
MNTRTLTDRRSIVPCELDPPPRHATWLTRLARRLLFAQLRRLEHGELRLRENGAEQRFGRRTARLDLSVTVHVEQPQLYALALLAGTVGVGEAYIRGWWSCDDLTGLVRIFVVNRAVMDGMDGRWALLSRPLLKLLHALNRNSRAGSARNIAAHYDLGNDFYRLVLDETMAYSCAIYPQEQSSLHEAQLAK